jgi:hypothetical protein
MMNENPGTAAPILPDYDAKTGPVTGKKASWSAPILTRLDVGETQGIPRHNPGRQSQKQLPEEMVFFGS